MPDAASNRVLNAIALIDGEHYPDVTLSALGELEESGRYRLVALVFLGGTEKVSGLDDFSYRDVPIYSGGNQVADLRAALSDHETDVVLDLSDEPVLDYRRRFRLISEALSLGAIYCGADFQFEPVPMPYACDRPTIGIWGSGKRVGKTAVSGYLSRHLSARGVVPCVCTMGRGGPEKPELLSEPRVVNDRYLRELAQGGRHAASDSFEDCLMGQAVTVGCRRCGGGMAGRPFYSNVLQGAELACSVECDVVIFEGSGAAIPPVGVDGVLLVVSAAQPLDYILGYLGPYRLLLSDLVVVTMCEEFLASSEKLRKLINGILAVNPEVKVQKTVFRPRPLGDLKGKTVFLASTAPGPGLRVQADYLESEYGAEVIGGSANLADRERLRADLEGTGADVLVTELKAAGVDVVSM